MPDPTERFGDPPPSGPRSVDEHDAPDFTPASDKFSADRGTDDFEAEPVDRGAFRDADDLEVEPADRGSTRMDMALLAVAALLIRVPAFLSSRHLTFDDGVFASSVIAMRDGALPFRDVFSSQGPLFLPLAFVGDLIGFRTLDAPRVLAILSGVSITLTAYWCLRTMAGRRAAVFGSLVVLTSGCLMWVTGPLAADGPALAFAMLSFALALVYNRRPTLRTALLMGLAVGATLCTKAMEAPILLPVVMVLGAPLLAAFRSGTLRVRSFLDTFAAAAISAVLFLAISVPFGLSDVWDQSFRYRTEAASARDPLANAAKIISTMWDRDLVIWLCAAAVIAWSLRTWSQRRNPGGETRNPRGETRNPRGEAIDSTSWATRTPGRTLTPSGRTLVVSWTVFSFLWLVFMVSPMWRPHVSAMVPPLALLLGLFTPPRRVLLVLAVIAVPLTAIQLDGLLAPGEYKGSEAEVVSILEGLPTGAWALSDEPGLVWRAGRRTTANMVDPSMLRVQQGRYTAATLAEDAALPQVCAVVVRSNERFGSFPDLGERLDDEGYTVAATSRNRAGDDQRVYVKTDCDPLG
ncbi:MAG: hypothetical protein WBF71_08210 [Microthrixaceae bacterium]